MNYRNQEPRLESLPPNLPSNPLDRAVALGQYNAYARPEDDPRYYLTPYGGGNRASPGPGDGVFVSSGLKNEKPLFTDYGTPFRRHMKSAAILSVYFIIFLLVVLMWRTSNAEITGAPYATRPGRTLHT